MDIKSWYGEHSSNKKSTEVSIVHLAKAQKKSPRNSVNNDNLIIMKQIECSNREL